MVFLTSYVHEGLDPQSNLNNDKPELEVYGEKIDDCVLRHSLLRCPMFFV